MFGAHLAIAFFTQTPTALEPSKTTQIVFLGTGNPNPDPHHQGPALAVVVNGQPYIVDCGPGVVRQASAGLQGVVNSPIVAHLTRAFITHLHSDHTMGYPDLMFTPAVTGREEPLEVYGPKGLTRMTRLIERAWSEDRDIRIHGLEHGNPKAYEVHVHEIAPGEIYQDANVKVRAFLVNHGTWKFAFGYRFETPDRVIVISGDTTYSKNLIENAKGCDVLIHEVYSGEGLVKRTAQWQKYHSTFHTSARDVGLIGSLIKPKLLILYHELPFGEPDGEILGEVKSVYNGPVVEAHDLERF